MSEAKELIALVKKQGYTHLIFDLDETLTRLDLPWSKWIQAITQRLSPEGARSFQAAVRDPNVAWGSMLNRHIETYAEFLPVLLEESERFESTYFAHTPYDELVRAVKQLVGQGVRCILWTNNMSATAERALLELGIRQHFDHVITRDKVRLNKPNPEGWQLVPKDINTKDCLFIGDSDNDRRTAESLGMTYYPIRFFK